MKVIAPSALSRITLRWVQAAGIRSTSAWLASIGIDVVALPDVGTAAFWPVPAVANLIQQAVLARTRTSRLVASVMLPDMAMVEALAPTASR